MTVVEVQLVNKLFRVKIWPNDTLKKPKNFPFKQYGGARDAWDAVKKEAPLGEISMIAGKQIPTCELPSAI